MNRDNKMVIIARKDLGMRSGKLAAQVSHAVLGAVINGAAKTDDGVFVPYDKSLKEWLEGEFTKVVLRVDSEDELLAMQAEAKEAGLRNCLITDAGHTVFDGVPTRTCLALGPAKREDIDAIAGHLKLY